MKVKVLVAQSYPTLCDTVDCSLPGSSVHGTLQARILKQVAISFSRESSQTHVSHVSCTGREVLYQLSHWGSTTPPPEILKPSTDTSPNN